MNRLPDRRHDHVGSAQGIVGLGRVQGDDAAVGRWDVDSGGVAHEEARGDSPQAMFGIVQGALFKELRRESAARTHGAPTPCIGV